MIIDVNVNLSRYPTRRLPYDDTQKLVSKLREHHVKQAWAGSFDGLLHRDIAAVNERLAHECQEQSGGLLVPWGSINPTLPDWREDVRRCAEDHKMPGVRLHPNYHGYKLDEPVFAELLDACDQHKLIIGLVIKMEDERTQHPLLQVPDVDTKPLVEIIKKREQLKVLVLNGLRTLRPDDMSRLAEAGQIWFEISMLEGVGGLEQMLKHVPLDRILFGSYFPFFYFDSALLKLRETEIGGAQREAIEQLNAMKLL